MFHRIRLFATSLFVAAALGIAGPPAWPVAGPPRTLSLQAAVALALEANPTIAAARLRRPVDLAAVRIALERPNPEMSLEAQRETPHDGLGLVLPIETAGKRRHRGAVAEAAVATGDAEVQRVIVGVSNDVRRAYFQVVAADRRTAVAEDLRGLATRAGDVARARFEAGDVPRLEVVQAELVRADAENEVAAAAGQARAALAVLNTLLGLAADTAVRPSDEFSVGQVPTLEAAVAQAIGGHADLELLDRRIAEGLARRDLARALKSPDVAAGAGLTYDADPEFDYGWRASLSFSLPLLTRHRAGVELEDAEVTRLRAERQARVAEIGGAIAAAIPRAAALQAQLARYEAEILPMALEVERMAEDAYRSGQTGLVELLSALQSAREVRRRGLAAGLDYQLSLADLERAIGAPLE